MRVATIFAVLTLLVSGMPYMASAECVEPGTIPITDRDLARLSGIPDSVTCWKPSDPNTGTDAANAKKYLLSIAKNLRNSQAPPDAAHIAALNSAFAKCAAKFLEAYIKQYGPVNVVSAFRCGPRSPAAIQCDRSENSRAGGATNSNHQLGTAMDINSAGGNSSYDTLKSFAQANTARYGVTFPWPFYDNKTDKPHMQAINTTQPSCENVTGTPVTPGPGGSVPGGGTAGGIGGTGINPGGLPGLMQGLQSFFSPPQPQQCQAGMVMMNGSCVPQQVAQTSSPFSYMNPPTPTPTPTPSTNTSGTGVTTGTGSTNTTGSNGTTGTGSGTDFGNSITISGLIDGGGDKKTGTSTSAIDLINSIANPTTTPAKTGSVTIGQSVGLNDSLENKATLDGTLASSSRTLAGSSTYALNAYSSQTFVSDDLSKTPVNNFQTTNYSSTFALLENIKQVLLGILQMLRPFGGITPTGTVHGSGNTATAILR